MDDKFDKLMKEICQSKCEVTEKLSTSIAELKYEANSVQQDLTGPNKDDWQFKLPIQIKGDKHHYNFNCTIKDAMCSVKERQSQQPWKRMPHSRGLRLNYVEEA